MVPFVCRLLYTAILLLSICVSLSAQYITDANKCYEEKNYDCAFKLYQDAITSNTYKTEDRPAIDYRMGYCLNQLKRYKEAIPYFKSSIAGKSSQGFAYWELAVAYYNVDSFLQAGQNYEKAIPFYREDKKSSYKLNYYGGQAYSNSKRYATAIRLFNEAAKLDSSESNVFAQLGASYYNNKDYKLAIPNYKRAIEMGEKANVAKDIMANRYYWYAYSLFNDKQFKEALLNVTKAKQLGFTKKDSEWLTAGIHYNLKNYREAVSSYSQVLPLLGNDSTSAASVLAYRGRSYMGLKDYSKAEADFARSLQYNNRNYYTLESYGELYAASKKFKEGLAHYAMCLEYYHNDEFYLADFHYKRAALYLEMKDTVKAKSDLYFALEYKDKHPLSSTRLADIEFAQGNYQESVRHYINMPASSIHIDSATYARHYFQRGFAYMSMGNSYITYANTNFRTSLRYDSSLRKSQVFLGKTLHDRQDYKSAEIEYTKAIPHYAKNKDTLAILYMLRAESREKAKDYKGAIEDLYATEKLRTLNASEITYLARILFETKEYKKAIGYFDKLPSLYKPDQKSELLFVYYGRGRCYLELQDKKKAKSDFEKALSYDPANKEVQTWMKKTE